MSPERAELERLVDEPPQDQVPIVLADVRRRLSSGLDRPWPPAYFAGAPGDGSRMADLLREEFGR